MLKEELVSDAFNRVLSCPFRVGLMAVVMLVVDDAMAKELKLIGAVRIVLDGPMVSHWDVGKQSLSHLDDC